MKYYVYYDENKPYLDLVYNILEEDINLVKIEIEADSADEVVEKLKEQLEIE